MSWWRDSLLSLTLVGLASTVHAQGAPSGDRHGLLAGGSIGLSNHAPDLCKGCEAGLDVGGRVGYLVSSRLSLTGEFVATSVAENLLSKNQGRYNGLFAAVAYWPAPRVWLKAGVGGGTVERRDATTTSSSNHAAGLLGIGVDVNPRRFIVFDLSLHVTVSGDSPDMSPLEAPQHDGTLRSVVFAGGLTWYHRR